jgi:hypothetical protein
MNDKRITNGEESVQSESVTGVSEEARTDDERQGARLEDIVDEVQKEMNRGVIQDMIDTQGAAGVTERRDGLWGAWGGRGRF